MVLRSHVPSDEEVRLLDVMAVAARQAVDRLQEAGAFSDVVLKYSVRGGELTEVHLDQFGTHRPSDLKRNDG